MEGNSVSGRTWQTCWMNADPGVYTVVLIAELGESSGGEPDTPILEYSIFHEVKAPTGYGTTR